MKQMIFLSVMSLLGIAGSFTISPIWGLAVYYMLAVVRPQFLWEWVEAMGIMIRDIQWSFSVAVATLCATTLWRIGLLHPVGALVKPWYGQPKWTVSHYLFLLFSIWISISCVTAVKPDHAEKYYIEYLKIFVMFFCATHIVRKISEVWAIYFVVLASAVYAAYEINFFYFVDGYMLLFQRGYGGLDNNGAALIAAMAVPMAYFAWEASSRWYRWWFLAVIPILVHAIQLSFSRGGMVSLMVTAIPVWLCSRHKMFLLGVYVLMLVFVVAGSGKELEERFLSISQSNVDESAQSRLTTWGIAIRMANERPFFGFGIRNSNLFTYEYGADIEGRSIHSQYLQVAADSGWVAMGLYVAMLVSTLVGLWRVSMFLRNYRDPESLKVRAMVAGLGNALILFCVGAAFLSLEHFEMPYIILLLGMQVHAITRMVAARQNALVASTPAARAVPAAQLEPQPVPAVAR
jgi:probable O-glycosylation ligase (exosortase A-associated)